MANPKHQFEAPVAPPKPEGSAPSPTAAKTKPASSGFQSLEQADQKLPRLQIPGAWPVERDRWERLVTTSIIPASVEQVWQALTDPAELKKWLAVCLGSLEQPHCDCVLDFEDGEFFLCRATEVNRFNRLQYLWRWLGIGQATSVTWELERLPGATKVTVTEEALNPPWDWQTWNGGGWPGILDQLAAYLRTGLEWRWPWRRMGPYVQVELATSVYEAWDKLFNADGLKYWLLAMEGNLAAGESLKILMGDASGIVDMNVREIVRPGQSPPSFLPWVNYTLKREAWGNEIGGRLWIEPAGWGRCLLQVFHFNWESLPAGLQLSERRIMTNYWASALARARMMCGGMEMMGAPHNW